MADGSGYESKTPKGCAFLIDETGSERIFTVEDFSEEQLLFAQTARDFIEREVTPHIEEMEAGDHERTVELLRKAGDLGLLMADIPEAYGGLQVDKATSMIISENLGTYAGFATTHGAQTSIGMLPIVYFGTEEQKQKWLPRFATGETMGAYCLTEPGSGSDALAAKTRATLSEDGEHYIIKGTKMWITNAGFATLFTVFAQLQEDGDKFTAFLVEADREGVSLGAEEKKLGLKGSSTRVVNFDDVKIPKENLLGQKGKGHKIAFNTLNFGRFKLGCGSLGGAKHAIAIGANYARERKQFGQPIANFGAIKAKLGEMAKRCYALESMVYRVAGYMDRSLELLDNSAPDYQQKAMKAIEEFAVEDSIMKVYGSETLAYVADEVLQIHGGNGFSAEYAIERIYRDQRINRIFEGTNEINRLLIPGMILKRTMKGQLDLFSLIQKVEASLASPSRVVPPAPDDSDPKLGYERFLTEQAKRVTVYVSNQAIQKHMADLRDRQEILLMMADMLIETYAMDSAVTRSAQLAEARGVEATVGQRHATRLITVEGFNAIRAHAEQLLCHLAQGDKLTTHLDALHKLTFVPRVDTLSLRRDLGDRVLERERYPF